MLYIFSYQQFTSQYAALLYYSPFYKSKHFYLFLRHHAKTPYMSRQKTQEQEVSLSGSDKQKISF